MTYINYYMCGILGQFHKTEVNARVFEESMHLLFHRGPDNQNISSGTQHISSDTQNISPDTKNMSPDTKHISPDPKY